MQATLTANFRGAENLESETFALAAGSSPISLWLVDDNRRLRTTLAGIFEDCDGVRCTGSFASPNAVLSALASRVGPDIILMDVHMGEANGIDAIRAIKSLSRSTRVLMLTTFFDQEAEARALMSGASGFLLKSFPFERILASIREAWQKPSPPPKKLARVLPLQGTTVDKVPTLRAAAEVAAEKPRQRMLWVKHCLDLIRLKRN